MSSISINDSVLNKAAAVLKAVAHPTRLKIVCLLGSGKRMSVSEIGELTGCEQSLLSHHLNNMRTKGVLAVERDGKNIFYSLSDKRILKIVKCVD